MEEGIKQRCRLIIGENRADTLRCSVSASQKLLVPIRLTVNSKLSIRAAANAVLGWRDDSQADRLVGGVKRVLGAG